MSNLSYVYQFSLYYCWTLTLCQSAAETERGQAFRDEILGHLPFVLIGMDVTLPSVVISASGGTNDHYSLERHDISGV